MITAGRFAKKIDNAIAALEDVAARVDQIVLQQLRPVAEAALEEVSERTPIGDRPGTNHIAHGWRMRAKLGSEPGFVIYNANPRANAIQIAPRGGSNASIPGRLGSGHPATLLHMLEYGTGPHLIVPRGPWRLKFFWKKIGKWVALTRVNHPGNMEGAMPSTDSVTRFSMIRPTIVAMQPEIAKIAVRMTVVVRNALKGASP